MKASLLYDLQSQGFKVYPKEDKYLVFWRSNNWGVFSVRQLVKLARTPFEKIQSKFKQAERRKTRRTEKQKMGKETNRLD